MYMYKVGLALINRQELIEHTTRPQKIIKINIYRTESKKYRLVKNVGENFSVSDFTQFCFYFS